MDAPIGEVIPEDLLTGIAQLLEQQMPVILESLLEWLQGEEQAVAAMLESADPLESRSLPVPDSYDTGQTAGPTKACCWHS